MRKIYSILTIILMLCFTQCAEDELLTDSNSLSELQLNSARTLDAKAPRITKVTASGSQVTIEFTNPVAPSRPEGGFELMVNGKRTYTNIIPRLYSSEKYLKMTFSISQPNSIYQVYARWNTGYLRSNEMGLSGSTDGGSSDSGGGDVSAPSNPKEPVISNLAISGSTVTLKFVNFASPSQPEGGYELIVDGQRTGTDIVSRLYSKEKYLTMQFSISNADDRCYQIYARWNTGYLRSNIACNEGGQSGGSSSPTDGGGSGGDDSGDSDDTPSGISGAKLVRSYEFENNIGRNVSQSQDGLHVHHLGRQDGKVVSEDGKGAYRFRVTPGNYTSSDPSHRLQLTPRNLPDPYFSNGFVSQWRKEYIYKIRLKLDDSYKSGNGYVKLLEFKNDYGISSRIGGLVFMTEGDHYVVKQTYARNYTTNPKGEYSENFWYDARGKKLVKGEDFHKHTKMGSGYNKINEDYGRWVEWTIEARWSYGDDGYVKIYKNGNLFHTFNGPTAFKHELAPYVAFGLYNTWWKNGQDTGAYDQRMFVDYFRVYAKNW